MEPAINQPPTAIARKPLPRSATIADPTPNSVVRDAHYAAPILLARSQTSPLISRKPLASVAGNEAAHPPPNLPRPWPNKPPRFEKVLGHSTEILNSLTNPSHPPSTRRISKPPTIHARKHNPRKRLQKRAKRAPSNHQPSTTIFLLSYERYPYNTEPGELLGAYSNLQTVTTAAIKHGAYAFSKEGMQDGTEYLSPTGRIKILPTTIQRTGPKAALPRARNSVSASKHSNAHDASPRNHTAERHSHSNHVKIDGKEGILVAVHQPPTGIFCIGAFTERKRAWECCLKHHTSLRASLPKLSHEKNEWIDAREMPHMKAREMGVGQHEWFVVVYRLDADVIGPT